MSVENGHNGKVVVDIDGLDYHCRMIQIYLNDIKEGRNFLADVRHHIEEMQDIFDEADFRRVA